MYTKYHRIRTQTHMSKRVHSLAQQRRTGLTSGESAILTKNMRKKTKMRDTVNGGGSECRPPARSPLLLNRVYRRSGGGGRFVRAIPGLRGMLVRLRRRRQPTERDARRRQTRETRLSENVKRARRAGCPPAGGPVLVLSALRGGPAIGGNIMYFFFFYAFYRTCRRDGTDVRAHSVGPRP